jgi:8-oxo-dGTP diphosphatase
VIVVNTRGEVLLGRRNIHPFHGWWDIPGGFLEAAEHPEAGARRELAEETGLEGGALRLVGVFMDQYGESDTQPTEDLLNFYYECRVVEDASPAASDDIEALAWFAPQDLPVEEVAFAANRAALRAWLAQKER